ncbi:hypothetical protein FA13DRAFT_1740742 [Coprinellus micaceus]|uniref:Uncharacterized protein n=1 Tax=Coprinellus micaceus TaxID=71717 RepID=A0A4Y7SLA4_COPMI|nr:hypothetical protein FA13DRAFT_1740742 [Coprinellus micaceus]
MPFSLPDHDPLSPFLPPMFTPFSSSPTSSALLRHPRSIYFAPCPDRASSPTHPPLKPRGSTSRLPAPYAVPVINEPRNATDNRRSPLHLPSGPRYLLC